MRVFR
jgi:hypothetical protein